MPLYVYTTSCLSIHPSMDVWFPSSFWLLWIMLLWTGIYKYLFELLLSVLLDKCPEVELLGYMVLLCLTFWRAAMLFPGGCTILRSPQQCTEIPASPHPRQHLLFSGFLMIVIQMGMRCYLIVALICISLKISSVEHLFLYLLAICISSLEKCQFKTLAHFLIGLLVFFLLLSCYRI